MPVSMRPWLESICQDVHTVLRMSRRNPTFPIAVIVALGLGIGAAVAVFTQINAVFIARLPVANAADLRTLSWTSPGRAFAGPMFTQRLYDNVLARGGRIATFSFRSYERLRQQNSSFVDVACWNASQTALPGIGSVRLARVSSDFFGTLGASAQIGRTIGPADGRPGAPPVAVIGHDLWQRAFGGDSGVVGRTTTDRGTVYEIVGVAAERFRGIDPVRATDVWASLPSPPPTPDTWLACSGIIARLKPGVSDTYAREDAERLVRQAIAEQPAGQPYTPPALWVTDASRGFNSMRQNLASPFALMAGVVALVLAMTCINVAGLLLARMVERQPDISTRLALGASPSRVIRLLLTESLVLAGAGGALGFGIACLLLPLMPALLYQIGDFGVLTSSSAIGVSLAPDVRVFAFAVAVTFATVALFGVFPALRGTRDALAWANTRFSSAGEASSSTWFRGRMIIAGQLALATTIVLTTGLFVRTLVNLGNAPLGYRPGEIAFFIAPTAKDEPTYVDDTVRQLRELPGVVSAAASMYPLFNNAENGTPVCVPLDGAAAPVEAFVDSDIATPAFFRTWGVSLIGGREFEWTDRKAPVAVVNETFARTFFGGAPAVGRFLRTGSCAANRPPMTIVGVVADHRDRPRETITPMLYVPSWQRGYQSPMAYAVRTDADVEAMVPILRRFSARLSPTGVPANVITGIEYRDQPTQKERTFTALFAGSALLAVFLCCFGTYALFAYSVARRTREIGIRSALGADRQTIVRLIAGHAVVPVAIGIGIGLLAGAAVTRPIGSWLFGVSRFDGATVAATIAVLVLTSVSASLIPAWHASRVELLEALRCE